MRTTPVTTTIYKLFISSLFALTLAACGGGAGDDAGGGFGSGGGGNGGTGGGGGGGSTGGTTGISIGSFDNSSTFNEGQIAIGQSPLAAGGSSSLSVAFVDEDGIPVSDAISVTFISICLSQGKAEIVNSSGTPANPVTTIGGGANATYVDKGCQGTDNLIARATIEDDILEATGSIQVQPAEVGGLQFISAVPNVIGIKGTGKLDETSQVTFQVNDSSGSPAVGKTVNFALASGVGGVTLSTSSATSGADGHVSTVVSSGTQATSVRVRASTLGAGGVTLTTESDALAVTTGVADSDSFSLSAEIFNPQGFNFDGETSNINILAGDAANNPVPDGFNINFTTEGGAIEGSCLTNDNSNPQQQPITGGCSVQWTSQNPRPPADGRTTILASAEGVESFTDQDGDGLFDDPEPFEDLGEPFRDENEDGAYQIGEFFIDFNTNGVRDGPNTRYDGLLCDPAAALCDKGTVAVGENIVLVMAESTPAVSAAPPGPYALAAGGVQVVTFTVEGAALGQIMPIDTTISVSVGGGFSVLPPSSSDVPNSNANAAINPSVNEYTFAIKAPDDCSTPVTDVINLTVSVPAPGNTDFIFSVPISCS